MNQSVLVNTLKDAVDYALLLNISFFVYDNIITEINQKIIKHLSKILNLMILLHLYLLHILILWIFIFILLDIH